MDINSLRGWNSKIREGEFVAIQGASGSGKSTAMNMVGCLDVPTRGKVFLDGRDISKLHESDLAQIRGRRIGFIFQQFNLIPTLTALENVTLPMVFQGIDEEKRIERGEEMLKMVGLGDRMNHRPTEYPEASSRELSTG